MAKAIGTLGTIDTITIGGRVFTDTTNIIILFGFASSASNLYSGLFKQGGSSGAYQVTTGKTLTISAAQSQGLTSTPINGDIGQCDNALGISTASTPTTPVYFSTNSSGQASLFLGIASPGQPVYAALNGKILSQKFGFFTNGGVTSTGGNVFCFGYEA